MFVLRVVCVQPGGARFYILSQIRIVVWTGLRADRNALSRASLIDFVRWARRRFDAEMRCTVRRIVSTEISFPSGADGRVVSSVLFGISEILRLDRGVNAGRLLSPTVCFPRAVDDHMGDFLSRGNERLVGARAVVEGSGFAVDTQADVVYGHTRDHVCLIHGLLPGAAIHARGVRVWRRLGLRFDSVDGTVEQRFFARPALPLECMVWHKVPGVP